MRFRRETEEEAKKNISNAIEMMEDLIASTSKQQSEDDVSESSWKDIFNVAPPHLLAGHDAIGD